MSRELIDLLWRDHPQAPRGGARGPRARVDTSDVVSQAMGLADAGGLEAVTIRALGERLGMSAMSVYTHVNGREDLLVLMADQAHATMPRPAWGRLRWPERVRRLASSNLELFRAHPWLLDVSDLRLAVGPGTIAKYDHELRAFDGTNLDPVDRDAALTFVLDFVRASAPAHLRRRESFVPFWDEVSGRLATYVGDDFDMARDVGSTAGESMNAPHDSARAWEFGLGRVIAGLRDLTTAA
jgi:AcrR family transcriptional regulator